MTKDYSVPSPALLADIIASVATTGEPAAAVVPIFKSLAARAIRVIYQAKQIIGEDSQKVSRPDDSWAFKWYMSLNASDDDVSGHFAHLLAGELQSPGSFRKRTLSILSDMNADEAHAFQVFCSHLFDLPGGMLEASGNMSIILSASNDDLKLTELVTCGLIELDRDRAPGRFFREVTLPKDMGVMGLRYFDQTALYKPITFSFPDVRLTPAGVELRTVSRAAPIDGLWERGVATLKKMGHKFLTHRERLVHQSYYGLMFETPKSVTKAATRGVVKSDKVAVMSAMSVGLINHHLKKNRLDPRIAELVKFLMLPNEGVTLDYDARRKIIEQWEAGDIASVGLSKKNGLLVVYP